MNLGQHNSRAIKALQGSVEDAQAYLKTVPEKYRDQVKSTLRTAYKVKQRIGK